jgi:hypothetical protein
MMEVTLPTCARPGALSSKFLQNGVFTKFDAPILLAR